MPTPRSGEDAYNAFIQPLIDQYGYIEDGVKTGGGNVGGGSEINNQDFSRQSFEIGYDYVFEIQNASHEFHIGYHTEKIEEDLLRSSNGWGCDYGSRWSR